MTLEILLVRTDCFYGFYFLFQKDMEYYLIWLLIVEQYPYTQDSKFKFTKKKLHVKSHCILTLICVPFSNFFSFIMKFNFYCINKSTRLIKALSLECPDHSLIIFGTVICIFIYSFHFQLSAGLLTSSKLLV